MLNIPAGGCIGTSGDHYPQEAARCVYTDSWTCKYLPGVKSAANILSPGGFVYERYRTSNTRFWPLQICFVNYTALV